MLILVPSQVLEISDYVISDHLLGHTLNYIIIFSSQLLALFLLHFTLSNFYVYSDVTGVI